MSSRTEKHHLFVHWGRPRDPRCLYGVGFLVAPDCENRSGYVCEHPFINGGALGGRGGGRVSDEACAAARRFREAVADIALEVLGAELEVACAVHPDQVRIEVEHDGGFGFAAVERPGLTVEEVRDVDIPCGDDADAGGVGDEGRERIEMGLVAVCSEEDELGDALDFPGGEDLVEHAVERFLGEGGSAGITSLGAYIDAVVHGWCAEHLLLLRQVDREFACDEYICTERQMWTVLLERADWNDQAWVAREVRGDIDPAQLIESEGCF